MNQIYNDTHFRNALMSLKEHFSIKSAFLFGSRAKGAFKEGSDYDILFVIEKTDLTVLERMQKASRVLTNSGVSIPMDIFLYTEDEFNKNKSRLDTIQEVAFTEGMELDLAQF